MRSEIVKRRIAMKKTLAVVAVLALAAGLVFAGGKKEDRDAGCRPGG